MDPQLGNTHTYGGFAVLKGNKKISILRWIYTTEILQHSVLELHQLTDGMQFKLTWSINPT